MYISQLGDSYQPGTWKVLGVGDEISASFTCPDCGKTGVLTDHQIDAGGAVSPSVDCPNDGCGFHQYVTLNDWGEPKNETS